MTSQAWKQLERDIAEALGGKRILRGADFSQKGVDVEVPDFKQLKIDAKYRSSPWKHHGPLKECGVKYCAEPTDIALVVTKTKREHGAVVSMSLADFATILGAIRHLRAQVDPNVITHCVDSSREESPPREESKTGGGPGT